MRITDPDADYDLFVRRDIEHPSYDIGVTRGRREQYCSEPFPNSGVAQSDADGTDVQARVGNTKPAVHDQIDHRGRSEEFVHIQVVLTACRFVLPVDADVCQQLFSEAGISFLMQFGKLQGYLDVRPPRRLIFELCLEESHQFLTLFSVRHH